MFESDNARKLKTKRRKYGTAAYCSITSLVCIMLLFPEISTEHPPVRQYARNCIVVFCQTKSKNLVLVDGKHSATAIGQWADGVAGPGPDVRRAGSSREKRVTRLQPRAVDLLVSAE